MADQKFQHSTPIAASADKFAKAEATHHTTVGFDASLPAGGAPADATITVGTSGSTKWFDFGVSAWVKRQFTRKGTSAGVSGTIEF